MKSFLTVAAWLILLSGAIAQGIAPAAGTGDWTPLGGEYYRGTNWVWRAHYDNCYGWRYYKLYRTELLPAVGSPDFWTTVARLNANADEKQAEQSYVESRWPGRYALPNGGSTVTTGYNILSQGYQPSLVQGGTTLQSTGVPYSPIDVNGIIHEAQRLQELAGVNSSQANAQVNTIVNTAVEGNSAAARIAAAGQVAAAAIAASQPPTTSTTVFQSRSINGSTLTATAPSSQGSGDAVALLSHGLLMQYCSACHNQTKHAGNLDLTVDPAALAQIRDAIEQKIRTGEMPKGKPPLIEAVQNGLLAGIPRGQQQPTQQPQPVLPPPPVQPPVQQPIQPPPQAEQPPDNGPPPMPMPPTNGQ